jgi:hypothetical protein
MVAVKGCKQIVYRGKQTLVPERKDIRAQAVAEDEVRLGLRSYRRLQLGIEVSGAGVLRVLRSILREGRGEVSIDRASARLSK